MARHPSLALGACLCLLIFAACSNDDDSNDATTPRTETATSEPTEAATGEDSAEPDLDKPASRFTVLQSELESEFLVDIPATFVLTAEAYRESKVFADAEEGYDLLSEWGYLGGYESGYIPEGRERAVLNGAYYFAVESHLFEDNDGAQDAYDYIVGRLDEGASTEVSTNRQVGNRSSTWEAPGGRIPNSSVRSLHHRVLFRRGNLLVMVATWGADSFMRPGPALDIAAIVDEKALGGRDAPEPTPTSGGGEEGEEETDDTTAALVGS